jgi:hypothetical protein
MKFWDIAGLLKSKTFVLALGAILAAIGGYLNHSIGLPEMIGAILLAIQSINVKDGQLTIEKKVESEAIKFQVFNSQNGDPRGGG